jgi:hypothetical protein
LPKNVNLEQAGTDPATGQFFAYFVYFVVTTPAADLPRAVWERLAADRRQALEDDLAWIHP